MTADLATEKYELTVHNFSEALTTTDSWLVNYVPKAILVYHDKRISARQQEHQPPSLPRPPPTRKRETSLKNPGAHQYP